MLQRQTPLALKPRMQIGALNFERLSQPCAKPYNQRDSESITSTMRWVVSAKPVMLHPKQQTSRSNKTRIKNKKRVLV